MNKTLNYREAHCSDIPAMHIVRCAVQENRLSDPSKVTLADYELYLIQRGKGWVCEHNGIIVGFAIVDLLEHNVWALFLLPAFEGQGIGKELQRLMMDWYFQQTDQPIWLSTGLGTRAMTFYHKQGWWETGPYGQDEIRFEMSFEQWLKANKS